MTSGFFTPTEAGGAGAMLAFIYAVKRGVRWKGICTALRETVSASATIFLILIGAKVFGFVLSTSQLSFTMVDFLSNNQFSPMQVLLPILVFYVEMGCFMESLAMIILTVPIFYSVVLANGFDPIWFGVIAVVTVELGLISPPIGMNLFMVNSVAKELPLKTIMVGVLSFVFIDVVRLAILVAFPIITLYLPGRL